MDNPLVALAAALDGLVRRHIFAQPMAKAFALSAYAEAEDSGEGEVFSRTLHHVHEPRLRRMIERHQEDERRHARVLRERRDALGLPALPVPDSLALVQRLSDAAGGVLDKPMATDAEIADAWALLYAIEERALDEFKRSGEALAAAGDDETSALFFQIRKDEERHLRYCQAVGRTYDPDFDARIARMRAVELRTYGAQSRAWTRYQLDSGFLSLPAWLDLVVRSMTTIGGWLGLPALDPVVETRVREGERQIALAA